MRPPNKPPGKVHKPLIKKSSGNAEAGSLIWAHARRAKLGDQKGGLQVSITCPSSRALRK